MKPCINDIEQRLRNIEKELHTIKHMLQQSLGNKVATVNSEMNSDILNVNEAMVLLNMERHVLYAKCETKELPVFKIGKQYKFKRSELLEWLMVSKENDQGKVDDFVTKYLQKNPVRG